MLVALFGLLAACDPAHEASSPPPALRRLSAAEVDHALSDLLGVSGDWARRQPVGGTTGSMDVVADWQVDGQELLDAWLDAIHAAREQALTRPSGGVFIDALDLDVQPGQVLVDPLGGPPRWVAHRPTQRDVVVDLPHAGRWTARLGVATYNVERFLEDDWERAFPTAALQELRSRAGDVVVLPNVVDLDWQELRVSFDGGPGPVTLRVDITTDGWAAVAFSGLWLDVVPDDPDAVLTPGWRALNGCADDACVRERVTSLARRAWRRPLTADEVDRVLADASDLAGEDAPPAAHIASAVEVLAASPHFLWVLPTPAPLADADLARAWHTAERLALLLWSSVPDEALAACADAKALLPDGPGACGLPATIERMLDDPRADALVEGFAHQWLGLQAAVEAPRDELTFSAWTEVLRRSMLTQVHLELGDSLRADVPLATLLTRRTAWLDARLGALYGVDVPAGPTARVPLPPEVEGGLLRTPAVLVATSQPNRTSPVQRGVWVLDRLLCDPPDPPPPAVPALGDTPDALQAHLAPGCVSCHREIDPLGVALDGYDAIGQPREVWADGTPVRTTATLVDGTPLDGLTGLARWVAAQPAFPRCAEEHLLRWAAGRDVQPADDATLDAILDEAGPAPSLRDLARATASHPAVHRRSP